MTPSQIRNLQEYIGVEPDGFWGPISTRAAQQHLRALMPAQVPWPKPDLQSLTSFYGTPAIEENLVTLGISGLLRFEGRPISGVRCHRKVADSLSRAIVAAYNVDAETISVYDGCYNPRRMRGGTSWSLHAWGAAVDFNAEYNGNHVHWPVAAQMPFGVMEAFAREGWLAAGAFWSRDAMHFQATQ